MEQSRPLKTLPFESDICGPFIQPEVVFLNNSFSKGSNIFAIEALRLAKKQLLLAEQVIMGSAKTVATQDSSSAECPQSRWLQISQQSGFKALQGQEIRLSSRWEFNSRKKIMSQKGVKQLLLSNALQSQQKLNIQMYKVTLRIFQTELVFMAPCKVEISTLEKYCEIVDYYEVEDGVVAQARNLKVRKSELINELVKVPAGELTA